MKSLSAFAIYCVMAMAPFALVACGAREPTSSPTAMPTEAPTATAEPAATDTPESVTATAVITTSDESTFASGGLGQEDFWWDRSFGSATSGGLPASKKYGDYSVTFMDGKASYIERQWPATQAVTPEEALAEGQQFAPVDAGQVETYSPDGRPETTVSLFMSPSLAERFEADVFIGGKPGNFTIQYNVVEGQVTRMIVALGNNP